ncbi:hypothetical protein BC827DRAFT_1242236, partial [Russula dissimulans]
VFYDSPLGRLTTVDREITARCIAILNRADPDLLKFMESMVNRCGPAEGETYANAEKLGHELLENCCGVVGQPPLYKDAIFPTAPHTEISVSARNGACVTLGGERLGGGVKGDHVRRMDIPHYCNCKCRSRRYRKVYIGQKCSTKPRAARTGKVIRGSEVKTGNEIAMERFD